MSVLSLGYVRLYAKDVDEWRRFAGEFMGLMPVQGDRPGAAYFRMDEYPPRLVISPAEAPGLEAVGLEVRDRRHLARMVERVQSAGTAVTAGTPDECTERRVSGFARFSDPGGNRVELFYGPVFDHVPVDTPAVSSFVTDDQGMGHVIVDVADTEAAVDFYTDVLGFEERNTLVLPSGTLYFLGCNPRQHTLGLAPAAKPGLSHLMVEAARLDDVGAALDRTGGLGVPMMQSLGRHTNDHMVSFYVYSPERYAVEVGWGADRIERESGTYRITEGAVWGHQFTPPPEAAKA